MSFLRTILAAGLVASAVVAGGETAIGDESISTSAALSLKGNTHIGKRVVVKRNCVACHGLDGQGVTDSHPNLAGQRSKYLLLQLVSFRKGRALSGRAQEDMTEHVAHLTAQEMADAASYYASLPCQNGRKKGTPPGVKPPFVGRCESCHGTEGQPPSVTQAPRLAGQNAQYLLNQITIFQKHARGETFAPGESFRAHRLMDMQVKRLSPDASRQIADYFATRLCH